MDDIRTLYYVLIVVYLVECVVRFRATGLIFATRLGRRWFHRTGGELYTTRSTAFFAGNPFPPFGGIFVVPGLAFAADKSGVANHLDHTLNRRSRPPLLPLDYKTYSEIESYELRSSTLRFNGSDFIVAGSEASALQIRDEIMALQSGPPAKREKQIRAKLRSAFDLEAARSRWNKFRGYARWLRPLAIADFVLIFIGLPLAYYYQELGRLWPYLLGGHLALLALNIAIFRAGHVRLFPELRFERYQQIAAMALSPPLLIRSVDLLGRDLFVGFHPLMIGRLLLAFEAYSALAAQALRDLRHPIPPRPRHSASDLDPDESKAAAAQKTADRYRKNALLPEVESFIIASGLKLESLLAPPDPREDDTARSYCPRCVALYTIPDGRCADCGVALCRVARSSPPAAELAGSTTLL
ncbi:MAG: hypothetical protein NXI24_07405 [bacterium]|nr:hypothetical protein [bacterium]